MARKISMIDLAGIGNLLEYLVAADNITCEERDRIILRIAKENDIAEYTLSALAGYGKSKSEVLESVARRKNSVSQDKKQDESYISLTLPLEPVHRTKYWEQKLPAIIGKRSSVMNRGSSARLSIR